MESSLTVGLLPRATIVDPVVLPPAIKTMKKGTLKACNSIAVGSAHG